MTDTNEITFEGSLERIRDIVQLLESGELSLEDSITQFREGSALIELARKMIADAELRVRVLTEESAGNE